ncbi:SIMPL domain-containing protein [Streptomyces sp. NPDC001455]|uniref:SIMPL domain-containing protein n=1 Tax=Streptomyces sp. NPDC001455 TaxID=3154518 RepID=UPI0033203C61
MMTLGTTSGDGSIMISVRGEATLEVDPELCEFVVTVMTRDKEHSTAVEKLIERKNDLVDDLKSTYGEALEKIESGIICVVPEHKGSRDDKIRSRLGSTRVQVVVKDLSCVGEMITRIANAEMRIVDGPFWSLRRDSAFHRQARREAVSEAMVRASEYAEATGTRITGLIELTDAGLISDGRSSHVPGVAYAAKAGSIRGGAAYGSSSSIALIPERQIVYASVEARFSAALVLAGPGTPITPCPSGPPS